MVALDRLSNAPDDVRLGEIYEQCSHLGYDKLYFEYATQLFNHDMGMQEYVGSKIKLAKPIFEKIMALQKVTAKKKWSKNEGTITCDLEYVLKSLCFIFGEDYYLIEWKKYSDTGHFF